jgi:mRNA interferase MazF
MIKRGQIVLLSFPFTDLQTTKVRPALVVSSDSFNAIGNDAIFIFITSKRYEGPFEIWMDKDDPEFQATKLKMPSTLRVSKIMCLEQDLVKRRLGYLDDKNLQKIEHALMRLFELNRYRSQTHNQGT